MEFLISFLVISIVGTLLHFVYEWSNHNKIVSLFAAVNESTWEHMMAMYMVLVLIIF